jgi:CHAD domain-containing protein
VTFRITEGESIEEAVRRIACDQIDKAASELSDDDLDLHETVHAFRKRCKKIRGLLRLVRPGFEPYSEENSWFRDRARQVSDVRDATSMQECLDALIERYAGSHGERPFADVREWLEQRRQEVTANTNAEAQLQEIRVELSEARQRVSDWELSDTGIVAVRAGFEKTYRRARKGMHRAVEDPTTANFHEWRKRVKYFRYHTRLLSTAWPPVLRALNREAHRLSDWLGDDHDLAVLRAALVAADGIGPAVSHSDLLALMDRRSTGLRAWTLSLGRRLFQLPPKPEGKWVEEVLSAWQSEQRLGPSLTEE